MKKICTFLMLLLLGISKHANLSAGPPQIVTGPGPHLINSVGEMDGVELQGQSVHESILVVPDGDPINSNGINASAVSTDASGKGKITFQGNSVVTGTVGASDPLDSITATGFTPKDIFFNGSVHALTIFDGFGGMMFNGPATANAFRFNGSGTMDFNANSTGSIFLQGNLGLVIIGPLVTFTGNLNNGVNNIGSLSFLGGGTFNGNVGFLGATPFPLFTTGIIANPVAPSTINGNLAVQTLAVAMNTLNVNGTLFLSNIPQFNIFASTDKNRGKVVVSGPVDFLTTDTTTVYVTLPVDGKVSFSGNPIQILSGESGGTNTGNPVSVLSNMVRYTFSGVNPSGTGDIFITPSLVPAVVPPGPGTPAARAFESQAFNATGDMLTVQAAVTALGSDFFNGLELIGAAEAEFAPIVNGDTATMSMNAIDQFQNLWASNLVRVRAASVCNCICECECENNEIWLDTFGYFPEQRKREEILGYDADQYGVMLAIQHSFCGDWQIGIGGGYAYTKIKGKGSQTHGFAHNYTEINTGDITLYLGYDPGCWYVDGFLSGAWNSYKGKRQIAFSGFDRTAKSDYNGQEIAAYLSTGYNFFCSQFIITPLASLQYTYLHIDHYDEKGAGAIDLIQKSQHYNNVESGLGAMLGYCLETCYGELFLEVHSKWLCVLNDYRIKNHSRFKGGGPEFVTEGVRVNRNGLEVGAGATLYTCGNWALDATYDYTYRHKFSAHEGMLSAAYRF